MSKTLEEKMLINSYRIAVTAGDLNLPLDPVELGRTLGLHHNKSKTVIKQMVRGNFFRKLNEEQVSLTAHGIKLAQALLSEP